MGNGETLLFHLSLSNPTNATQLTLTNISAITLDPSSGDLWVSLQGVGGIFCCNSSYESCIEKISNSTTGMYGYHLLCLVHVYMYIYIYTSVWGVYCITLYSNLDVGVIIVVCTLCLAYMPWAYAKVFAEHLSVGLS